VPLLGRLTDDRQSRVAVSEGAAVPGPVLQGRQDTGCLQAGGAGGGVAAVQGGVGTEAADTDDTGAGPDDVSDGGEVLLAVALGELLIGLDTLRGGHWTLLGLSGAIGFHLCLMLFGWGFWLWSLPTLTVLALCFVREIRRTP